jgi:copper chaperone CopZ
MKLLFIVFFLIGSISASKAQFVSAELGVGGLTCSACTKAVEMSIRKLDFVQDVQMNLENTTGKITFKAGALIYIDKIAKAVENAGFSVTYLHATFSFNSLAVSNNYCFTYVGNQYQFVKVGNKTLSGNQTITFIGKDFMTAKEYKKWSKDLTPTCSTGKSELFYVTL